VPKINADMVVLVVVVVAFLAFAPGHGVWGWVLAFLALVLVGAIVGVVGRRYPWIHGRGSRSRRNHD
jgi:hypothetical protein